MLSFFPLDVLDEIWDLIESVSEGFLTYSSECHFKVCSIYGNWTLVVESVKRKSTQSNYSHSYVSYIQDKCSTLLVQEKIDNSTAQFFRSLQTGNSGFVLDDIWDLTESVSEGFPAYFFL